MLLAWKGALTALGCSAISKRNAAVLRKHAQISTYEAHV